MLESGASPEAPKGGARRIRGRIASGETDTALRVTSQMRGVADQSLPGLDNRLQEREGASQNNPLRRLQLIDRHPDCRQVQRPEIDDSAHPALRTRLPPGRPIPSRPAENPAASRQDRSPAASTASSAKTTRHRSPRSRSMIGQPGADALPVRQYEPACRLVAPDVWVDAKAPRISVHFAWYSQSTFPDSGLAPKVSQAVSVSKTALGSPQWGRHRLRRSRCPS